MQYLITGGTGFVGRHLVTKLLKSDNKIIILTRQVAKCKKIFGNDVIAIANLNELTNETKISCIINLAGEPIADKRWSIKQKEILRSSRINTTREIIKLIERLTHKPDLLISASAIGYYGCQGDNLINEDSKPIDEFTHHLCKDWEDEALKALNFGIRVCITRFGVVLGNNGGALEKLLKPFKLGLGGKIGDGSQYFSWVHINDLIKCIEFLIGTKKYSGVFNVTAPNPATNKDFTDSLAHILSRPAFFNMPSFVCKALFGEMGDRLLLHGQRVYPKKLLDEGFKFEFENLESALQDLLTHKS